jgi:hypothetical protein
MLPILLIIGLCLFAAIFIRGAHVWWIRRQFRKPVLGLPFPLPSYWPQHRIWRFADRSFISPTGEGINSGQALYHFSKLTPNVYKALDRIHDPSKICSYDEILSRIASAPGIVSAVDDDEMTRSVKTAVGTCFLAARLESAGHSVEMNQNEPKHGWNACVDGKKVKLIESLCRSVLEKHLRDHAEVPVITVAEHAVDFEDDPSVLCLEDISGEEILEATDDVLVADVFDAHCPGADVRLVMRSLKYLTPVLSGHSDLTTALHNTAADLAGTKIGSWAGTKTFATLGALLGGPIGAGVGAILGKIGGGIVGRWIAKEYKERDLREACTALDSAIAEYGKAYVDGLNSKAESLQQAADRLRSGFSLLRFIAPTPGDVLRGQIRPAYERWSQACHLLACQMRQKTETEEGSELRFQDLGRELLSSPPDEPVYSPRLSAAASNIRRTAERVEAERKKLGYK